MGENVHMADVDLCELEQRLPDYLDRAERGELLRVTDRGRVGLRPVPRVRSARRVLDVLVEARGV